MRRKPRGMCRRSRLVETVIMKLDDHHADRDHDHQLLVAAARVLARGNRDGGVGRLSLIAVANADLILLAPRAYLAVRPAHLAG